MASSPSPANTEFDEADVWKRWKDDGEPSARLELFDRYAEVASGLARRSHRSRSRGDLDLADLIQQAHGALLETIDRYDPSRGVPFAAYATRRISGSLIDSIARSSDVRAQYSARARTRRDRVSSLSKASADSTPSEALGSLADLAVGLALGFMLEDGDAAAISSDASTGFDAYRGAAWRELLGRLTEELEGLPERERILLSHHYLRGVAFETLASLFGVSKGRISQLHHAALLTLRKRLALRGHFSLQR